MKYLLSFSLFYLLYAAVQTKAAFTHYGRCSSNLSDTAHCLPLERCEYYSNELNATETAQMCTNSETMKLICCPRIKPELVKMTLLVEQTTTTSTTVRPNIAAISKISFASSPTTTTSVEIRSAGINMLPQPPACGLMLSDRIYGGNDTQLDEFPWMVLLEYGTPKGREFQCGGTFINDRWVLTAAHCITGLRNSRLISVRLGEWNTDTEIDCITKRDGVKECAPKPIDMTVDRQLSHPQFDQFRFFNDIALLRLTHPVTPTQFIKPICLPMTPELRADTFLDAKADVSGWGRTENNDAKSAIKLKAELNVLSLSHCRQKYKKYNVRLTENQMCAGGVVGVDSCGGDSGGPLILELSSTNHLMAFYQIGVVSFGKKYCGISDTPGVYTRVGPYIDWIGTTIADNQN